MDALIAKLIDRTDAGSLVWGVRDNDTYYEPTLGVTVGSQAVKYGLTVVCDKVQDVHALRRAIYSYLGRNEARIVESARKSLLETLQKYESD